MSVPSGYVLWEGASVLTGEPIAAILTYGSTNTKTGDMDQVWILRRDVHPMSAVDSGADAAICGDCRHRPAALGTCYVNLAWAPANVWRAYTAGRYSAPNAPREITRPVRLGAYGDPAAVPFEVWLAVVQALRVQRLGWTGYTHQWRTCDWRFRRLLMASVDTPEEQITARAKGWRTFRVRTPDEPLRTGEIVCPASDEAGHRVTCAQCRLCMGGAKPAKSIAIQIHGATQIPFYRSRQGVLDL